MHMHAHTCAHAHTCTEHAAKADSDLRQGERCQWRKAAVGDCELLSLTSAAALHGAACQGWERQRVMCPRDCRGDGGGIRHCSKGSSLPRAG